MELTLSCSRGSTEVRPAQLEDIPEIMVMGRQFFDQFCGEFYDWDESSVFDALVSLLSVGILLVATKGNRLVGMIGGALVPPFFNKHARIAQEMFWWVQPGSRGSGLLLFRAFEQAAKDRGAEMASMSGVESIRGFSVGRFYERAGYTHTESAYLRKL